MIGFTPWDDGMVRLSDPVWKLIQAERQRDFDRYYAREARREAEGRPLSELERLQNKPRDLGSKQEFEEAATLRRLRKQGLI